MFDPGSRRPSGNRRMKFHCDRCKTRYSIADERVHGKILKIRCKNCSAVITVKETGPISPPRLPNQGEPDEGGAGRTGERRRSGPSSGSALQGAFEQALRRPHGGSATGSIDDAPTVLEAEWYVSQDGEQFGPFVLHRAMDWVSVRAADEELYCWSEGFDDWLPVEKVSHFRGLRGQGRAGRHSSGLHPPPQQQQHDRTVLSPPPSHMMMAGGGLRGEEESPVPLFAAAFAQVVADAPADQAVPPLPEEKEEDPRPVFNRRNGSPAASMGPRSRPPAPTRSAPGSRARFAGPTPAASPAPSPAPVEADAADAHDLEIGEASRVVKLPMLTRDPARAAPFGKPRLPVIQGGATVDVPRPEILLPRRRRSGLAVPLVIGSAVVVGVVSVLLFVALAGEDEDTAEQLRRARLGGDGLAYQFEDGKKGDKTAAAVEPAGARSGVRRPVRKPVAARAGAEPAAGRGAPPVGPNADEVDLSSTGGAARELDPDDLFDVYNANKIGVQMCFNNALKRDPMLTVRRADVFISVGTSGAVSSVSIPSLSGTPLGECLEKRIRVWRFPRATQVFNSKFPIIFQT